MEDSKKVLTYPKLSTFLSEIKKIFASKSHSHNVSQITDFPNIKPITNEQIESLKKL